MRKTDRRKLTKAQIRARNRSSARRNGDERSPTQRGLHAVTPRPKASLKELLGMMKEHGILAPDLDDREDIKRALIQLKDRLLIRYAHVAEMGQLPGYSAEAPEPARAWRAAAYSELSRPNSARGRKGRKSSGRSQRAHRNPLDPEELTAAIEYDNGDDPKLDGAFKRTREQQAVARQPLTRAVVESLFPFEGTLKQPDAWSPAQRFPQSLAKFDLVNRIGEMPAPPEGVGNEPFSEEAALDYIREAAGLSLREAREVLSSMKVSADNKGPRGGHKAMQPSSAMCKASRTRKLGKFNLPAGAAAIGGFDSVVILVSPQGEPQPRVMTWRHGAHIDCDLVGESPADVLRMIGRALQISLYWLAEKPKRLVRTRVYVGRVGEPGLRVVWLPGDPVSVDMMVQNVKKGEVRAYDGGPQDVEAYRAAMKSMFGADSAPVSRFAQKTPTPKRTREAEAPEGAPEASPRPGRGKKVSAPSRAAAPAVDMSQFDEMIADLAPPEDEAV